MLSPCSHICQVRKFWPCNSPSFLPSSPMRDSFFCSFSFFLADIYTSIPFKLLHIVPRMGTHHVEWTPVSLIKSVAMFLWCKGLSVSLMVCTCQVGKFSAPQFTHFSLHAWFVFLQFFPWRLKLQFRSNCSTVFRGCICICLSVSLILCQYFCDLEGLSVSLNLSQCFCGVEMCQFHYTCCGVMFDTCQNHITCHLQN